MHARAPRDWETSEAFGDGWGASAPVNVGKRARNKDRMRMEQRALEIQELSDGDDWFGNARNVRNRGMGGGNGGGGGSKRERDGGTKKDVKIRFGESAARKRDVPPWRQEGPSGPSLLERVHGGGGDDDKRSRRRHQDQRSRDRDRDRDRGHGERHHRDRERDRDDEGPGSGLRIRGSASDRSNPSRYRDDDDRRHERRGDDRRREDSRSEQERPRDGYWERRGGHERERLTSWAARGPQYKGGYAR